MKQEEKKAIGILEKNINYVYKDKKKALEAITHSSYAYERKDRKLNSNERLEFLGDSVLSFVITKYLYKEVSDMPEGEMSKLRASVVSEASLSCCAKKLKIGDALLLGKGEKAMGGRERASILADAVEAIIGSLFLDGGIDAAEAFIRKHLNENYIKAIQGELFFDYKTRLQEEIQKKGQYSIRYSVINEKGPDHDKIFTVSVSVNDEVMGTGKGRTKKEAEQNAAGDALDKLAQNGFGQITGEHK
ncbi:MAG TPA: ribonuclease III [Ruminiclostridium sp.]|nr:ribonuclease III [Clostridiaceae bacterium]HAA25472.1 ribonuclease III [Ruminiclostridium sp.]